MPGQVYHFVRGKNLFTSDRGDIPSLQTYYYYYYYYYYYPHHHYY